MANPPSQPQPQPQQAARPRQSNLLRYFAIFILTSIILVGIAAFIIWLVVKPKHLVYTIEDASIHNFNLTNANQLYANFDIAVRARNPNSRVSVYYDKVDVFVEYEDQTLATSTVAPFFQPHKNVTRLEVKLDARSVNLYGSMPKDLGLEKSSGGIELEVWVKARIRFKVGAWKSRDRVMGIYCSPVLVHFSKSRGFERTYCDVEL
ncbi:Late embryogenesis abundant protein [Quillaja saponaria]|uniref:Late embryogenesis abundant protein n=1 Tax=Quillaja saponaria TaxID=32244 RepID=A0AAD7KXZ6_QUISA|nr:Late embryogenesis abundant protein [Quillaja saponaria]